MSTSGGPRILSDNLVLCLDAHDAKSYAGEPTTNVLQYPESIGSGPTQESWSGTITANAVTAPDGTKTATKIKATSGHVYERLYIDTTYNSVQFTTGDTITYSIWIKTLDGTTTTSKGPHIWNYNSPTYGIVAQDLSGISPEWKLLKITHTVAAHQTNFAFAYSSSVSNGLTSLDYAIWHPQLEIKSYNTPYVKVSRSATNGWVDRTGNSNGTLVSAMTGTETAHRRVGQVIMPASSSYLNFDGDDDQLTCTTSAFDLKCFEIAIQQYQTVTPDGSMGTDYSNVGFTVNSGSGTNPHKNGLNIGAWTGSMTNETVSWWGYGTGSDSATYIRDTILAGWHIYTINWNGSTYDIWIDGSKKTTYSLGGTSHCGLFEDVTKVSFGKNEGWNYFFQGEIGLARCYKASLTDSQIKQNFKAHRGRFGI